MDEVKRRGDFFIRDFDELDVKAVTVFLAPQLEYLGLKRKYIVLKSDTGEFVENCFVLRPEKDKAAIAALWAYARETENKALAEDINKWVYDLLHSNSNEEEEK